MGFAVSPVLIGTLAAFEGWRTALVTAGVLGMAVALGLLVTRAHLSTQGKQGERRRSDDGGAARATFGQIVAMPVVVLAFGYFVLSSFAGAGIQSFAITALNEGYGATLTVATLAVTAYQLGSAGGILAGGVLADRTERHHRVAMGGLAIAAVLILAASNTALPPAAIVALLTGAGFAGGATAPSRDILVRRAAPQGGMGKVFGFVYSGFDVGNLIAPLAYGAILDHHAPSLVFVLTAALFAAGIVTVLGVGSRTTKPAAA
jgi:MFS family permease